MYEFDLASLLAFVTGDDPVRRIHLALPLADPVSTPGSYTVSVVAAEGDLLVTAGDANATGLATGLEIAAGDTTLEVDVTRFVRLALEEGQTRVTIRLEGSSQPLVRVLRPTLDGGPGRD